MRFDNLNCRVWRMLTIAGICVFHQSATDAGTFVIALNCCGLGSTVAEDANFGPASYTRPGPARFPDLRTDGSALPWSLRARQESLRGSNSGGIAAGWEVRDLIFTSTDPNATHVDVGLFGRLQGSLREMLPSGNFVSAVATVEVEMLSTIPTFDTYNFSYSPDTSNLSRPVDVIERIDLMVGKYFRFPVNRPNRFKVQTIARVSTGEAGFAVSDFGSTLEFNINELFTIDTPGVTVNSVSMGLVNNRLTTVPEPVSAGLLGLSAVLLAGCGRHWFRTA